MADALISPAVGGTLWIGAAALIGFCSKRLRSTADERCIPLMAVIGAFVFAAQMINFTIPLTGSSGHIGGGLLLAILIGPFAAFLTLASVLTIQAFFFADGGLLALGCNMINLGFFPCFIAYPFVYRPLVPAGASGARAAAGAVLAAVVGLELGAAGVILQTSLSGITALSPGGFALAMLPIHLAIGVVEGLATAAVAAFSRRHGLIGPVSPTGSFPKTRRVLLGFAAATLVVGGGLSWFASSHPDGLEWSVMRVTGSTELPQPAHETHSTLERLQGQVAILPDYGFAESTGPDSPESRAWPAVDAGTSLSGLVGATVTLGLVALLGLLVRRSATRSRPGNALPLEPQPAGGRDQRQ